MSSKYDFKAIEKKWQDRWLRDGLFEVEMDPSREKLYCLNMFPYPSGVLHVGHGRNYILGDAVVRFKMMQGYNVLAPMGWDAFGLPAENAAIKFNIHPAKWVADNIANMKRQFFSQGIFFDWRREINTSDPDYYKWTQWIFLKLYESGLAYKAAAPVNWCPSCKCALANEEVKEGKCERCGTPVELRDLDQWFFRITRYAQRLLDDLDLLTEWPEKIVSMQRNWIGRSEGTEVDFLLDDGETVIKCFTTRPDTLYGVTFFSLAPEHPIIPDLVRGTEREKEVLSFVERHKRVGGLKSNADAEKEGVFTGRYVVNPVNGERVPLWVANYALMQYGTGGVMAVPAHDQRDFLFARKYGLPVKVVIRPPDSNLDPSEMEEAYEEPGVQVNSGPFDGMPSEEAKKAITEMLEKRGKGRAVVRYRLRDWLISRQRYWGAPIPIVFCERCGEVPVPEKDLPVRLPELEEFKPARGTSPLASVPEFVETTCPACGAPAKRETDTIAQWLCSCWYFLRFTSPFEKDRPFDPEAEKYWMPVDQYIGGAEHAVLHLLYTRFIMKVLYDLGYVSHPEPFKALFTQGTIIKDGAKMSKSLGNVVSPDDIIERFGADTLRLYTLFIGPPERAAEWTDESVQGCHKFLRRVWEIFSAHEKAAASAEPWSGPAGELNPAERKLRRSLHQTIRRVREDIIGHFHFNTAIAALMEFYHVLKATASESRPSVLREAFADLALMLAPMAPHIAEEIWERLGNPDSVFRHPFPDWDEEAAAEELIEVPVQVNGRLRGKIKVAPGAPREELERAALEQPNVARWIEGKKVQRIVAIPERLVNIVVR